MTPPRPVNPMVGPSTAASTICYSLEIYGCLATSTFPHADARRRGDSEDDSASSSASSGMEMMRGWSESLRRRFVRSALSHSPFSPDYPGSERDSGGEEEAEVIRAKGQAAAVPPPSAEREEEDEEEEAGSSEGEDENEEDEESEEDDEGGGDSDAEALSGDAELDSPLDIETIPLTTRLEDLSESDFDEEDFEAMERLAAQLRAWLSDAPAPGPARPLKCTLCRGALMLKPVTLRQHVASKRHMRRLAAERARERAERGGADAGSSSSEEDEDAAALAVAEGICFAEDYVSDSEKIETAEEGAARLAAALRAAAEGRARVEAKKARKAKQVPQPGNRAARRAAAGLGAAAAAGKGDQGSQAGSEAAAPVQAVASSEGKKREKKERKRPGKRQRQALKPAPESDSE